MLRDHRRPHKWVYTFVVGSKAEIPVSLEALREMANSKKARVDRRGFLKGAAAGAAALVAKPPAARAQDAPGRKGAPLPSAPQVAAETSPPPKADVYTTDRPGSDFMLDVIKSLGFEYVAANPGSSFRGLHESIINYGGNKNPELLTCCHEESSVAMAHGYAKIEGKPMMIMAHGTVGLQHASMAIYNAYADRVPVYIVLGKHSGRNFSPQRRGVGSQRAGRGCNGSRLHANGTMLRFRSAISPNPPSAHTKSR